MVELGGGTTDLAIFHERKIRHLSTLPWGGGTVTNDIVKGLSLPYAEAVARQGSLGCRTRRDGGSQRGVRTSRRAAVQPPRQIARELLAHIIEQRMDEIFGLVAEQIERSGFADRLAGGVVLTGGGATLAGVAELAEASFAGPVRIGTPGEGLEGLVDSVRRPRFATAVGLAMYGAGRQAFDGSDGGASSGSPVNGVIKSIRDWLTDFF